MYERRFPSVVRVVVRHSVVPRRKIDKGGPTGNEIVVVGQRVILYFVRRNEPENIGVVSKIFAVTFSLFDVMGDQPAISIGFGRRSIDLGSGNLPGTDKERRTVFDRSRLTGRRGPVGSVTRRE